MQQPKGVSMGLFGDILSIGTDLWNAEQNRDAAAQTQQRDFDFQRDMSNTQYQRMVTDLNKAGLSPMLAYSKTPSGSFGSSPTGTSSIQAPKFGETDLREAQSEQARGQAEVLKTTAEVNGASAEKLRAETNNINQDTENKRLYPGFNDAQVKELLARVPQHGASAGQLTELMKLLTQQRKLNEPEEKFKEKHPTYSMYASPVMDALSTIFKGVGLFRGASAVSNTITTHPDGSKSTSTTTRKGR